MISIDQRILGSLFKATVLLCCLLICDRESAAPPKPTTRPLSPLAALFEKAKAGEPPLQVWLFTAQDRVPPNLGTPIIIGIRNNSLSSQVNVCDDILVLPVTQPTDTTSPKTRKAPSTALSNPFTLRAEVRVKGAYPNSEFVITPTMDLKVEDIPLTKGHVQYFPSYVMAGFMQTGTYEMQALLLNGDTVVASSDLRRISIIDDQRGKP